VLEYIKATHPLGEAIQVPGSVPTKHIEEIIDTLVSAGLVKRDQDDVLTWSGPKS
jgi:hypothetical protein